jgi:hypothetical protein
VLLFRSLLVGNKYVLAKRLNLAIAKKLILVKAQAQLNAGRRALSLGLEHRNR